MPTGAPGYTPRRSSYAAVLSGTAGTSNLSPTRAGAFASLLNRPPDPYEATYQYIGGDGRYNSRGVDMENHRNSGGYGFGSGPSGQAAKLPSFSSGFGSFINGPGYDGFMGRPEDMFFTPSYLRGSKYVQSLEEAHKSKVVARRDAQSAHSSQPGSLSTSNSSANLHAKLVPSHRGMTYDLIEKAPPLDDEGMAPLPSKWNTHDKYGGLEVQGDGLDVKFTGRASSDREHEASSIRADHYMPPQCGIYYYEVTIVSRKRDESSIGIGFSKKNVALSRPPGWEPDSWAYHSDDGRSFASQNSVNNYGPQFSTGDVIGCGVNFATGCAFFTKNGNNLGTAFREIKGKLYPCVGMKRAGEHVRVNFGQTPFVFDIDGMMSREKSRFRAEVEKTSTSQLAPPLDETSLIQSLILQFLSHDGYVETARAFAEEVHSEREALNLDPALPIKSFDFMKEDQDAINRQRIRSAILDGDVDKALKRTNAYYPHVLKDNENIYFRLKVRKFIEMIRQAGEVQASNLNGKRSNGHGSDWYEDVINHEMELDDDHVVANNGWGMDTDGTANDSTSLLNEALAYGQTLDAEFKNDPRNEVKKALQEAFSLMAYPDPMSSPNAHLLKRDGRISVAEELNSAILVSLGKSSSAALERLIQQTSVLCEELREGGGPGAFTNIDEYMKPQADSQEF